MKRLAERLLISSMALVALGGCASVKSGAPTSSSSSPSGSPSGGSSGSNSAAGNSMSAVPAGLSFGNVVVGNSSMLPLSLQNSGTGPVTISSVTISGPAFNATGLSAGQVVQVGQAATLNVTFAPSATGSLTGNVTVAGDAMSSPLSVSLTGSGTAQTSASSVTGAPICGKSGDTSVHVPSDWETFVPPAKGQSYVDPTFGCTVTRITDASSQSWSGSYFLPMGMGYATVSPFNANDTYLMVADGWGRRTVTDLKGNVVVPMANIPAANNGWAYWDAQNPAVFYYTKGNSLMSGTIAGNSVTSAVIHQFLEYAAINFMDETDVSQDGAHVVLIGGDNTGSSVENVFDYNLLTDTKGPVYTTTCVGVIDNGNNGCLHKLIQTPDNNILIDFASDGSGPEQGVRLWTGTYPLTPIQNATDHIDSGNDMNGSPVFIELGNSTTVPGETNPCPSGWGLDVRMIYNMGSATCLLDNEPPWHVGYRGNKNQPWVVLSFDDQGTIPGPEWFDGTSNYAKPSTNSWKLYQNEIMVVRIDANNDPKYVYRLAHAYSRTDEDFNAQVKAAISRDGKYLAFDSNMAYAHTGCPANFQTPTNCADVYVIKIH